MKNLKQDAGTDVVKQNSGQGSHDGGDSERGGSRQQDHREDHGGKEPARFHHSHNHHGHGIVFQDLDAEKREKMQNRLLLTMGINVGITATEVVIGIWANSMALLSDALHNFSDVLALVLSLIGLYLLKRKAENRQTFGYQRVELVIGLINSLSLIFIGLFALSPSLRFFYIYIQNGFQNVAASQDMLGLPIFIASLISIVLNGLSVHILARGEHQSVSIRSSVLHLFSDLLTSVAVCVAGLMIYFFEIYWVDPLISMIIALYIIFSSYKLAKYTIQVLLNFNTTGIHVKDIGRSLCQLEEVHSVSHIHLWSLSEATTMLEAHVGVEAELCVSQLHELNQRLKKILRDDFHIGHTTFEFHPSADGKQKCQFNTDIEDFSGADRQLKVLVVSRNT